MSIQGCDISGWQPGQIDFGNMRFVYVKATQGTYKVNANHDAQVAEARALGLVVGHYHFPAWGDPVAEARAFVAAADWRPGEFMVLDIENSIYTPWPANPVPWCVAFENEVARLLGIWCLDYAGPNVRAMWNWAPLAGLGGGLIDPEYNNVGPSSSAPWANVAMWQNADTNVTGGDSDIFYGDEAALTAYGTPSAVTQSGTITPIQEADMDSAQNAALAEAWQNSKDIKATLARVAQILEAVDVQINSRSEGNVRIAAELVQTRIDNIPAAVLSQKFTTPGGVSTNLAGILDQINQKQGGVANVSNAVAELSAADLAALAAAVNDEADKRARARLGA